MPNSAQIFAQEFELLRVDFVKKYDELGMRSSGKWANSTEVESGEFFGRVLGEPYTEQLVDGRKPGKFPPIQAIEQWIIDKGIVANIEGNITVSSLAFLIARKIAREGTKYFQQGGTDLVDAVFTPKRVQEILNRLGESLTMEFTTEIIGQFKTVKV